MSVSLRSGEADSAFWTRVTEYLSGRSLNQQQTDAVTTKADAVIIEAGPGSGKTTVLSLRVAYLLQVRKISAEKLCVVTFTTAAAAELHRRLQRILGRSVKLQASTIHSLAFSLLREAGWLRGRQVASWAEPIMVIRQALRELGADEDDDVAEQVLTEISGMRNRMTKASDYSPQTLDAPTFRAVAERYEVWKRAAGKIDFDDMLVYLYMLLKSEPERFSGRFQHILVDEFQDTSLLQYDLLRRLAQPAGRLYVVGDVDQSIYGWRGAGPEVMLSFPRNYPKCERIILDKNYRAEQGLVASTNRLIQRNRRRTPKVIEAVHTGGQEPILLRPADDAQEAKVACDQLEQLHAQHGMAWDELAVIYRRNYQSLLFISEMNTRGLPFRLLSQPPNPFTHWVGRDVMSYARLALGERDPELLVRIINRPSRYIRHDLTRRASQRWVEGLALARAFHLQAAPKQVVRRIELLESQLQYLAQAPAGQAIHLISDELKYKEFVKGYRGPVAQREGLAHLALLEGLAQRYDSLQEFVAFGSEMHQLGRGWWRAATGVSQSETESDENRITLTTAHSAKGLEFDAVIVAGLVEGVLPAEGEDVEDERRLAYVAMTRARRLVILSSPEQLLGASRKPSRFVEEVLPTFARSEEAAENGRTKRAKATQPQLELAINDRVRHKTFGTGQVEEVDEESEVVAIRFADGTTRRLSLSICLEHGLLTVASS